MASKQSNERKKKKLEVEEAFRFLQQWRKWLKTDRKIVTEKLERICNLKISVTENHCEEYSY
jgi:sarcosine oxidase delta subunit